MEWSYSHRQPTTLLFHCVHSHFFNESTREGMYCGKSGKVSGMYCGKFIARWRHLYTPLPLPLPLPLIHIGWYHGSTHTDTNFFFEVGRRSNLLPLTPLSAVLPPLLLLCFFFTATAAAALLLLHSHRCRRSAFSSPPSCRYWCFFFAAAAAGASSSFLLLLLHLLCNMGLMIHIYIYI